MSEFCTAALVSEYSCIRCWLCGVHAFFKDFRTFETSKPENFLASQGRIVAGPQIGTPLADAHDVRPMATCGDTPI